MTDDNFIKYIDCTLGIAKWFILQVFLYFLMPYLWNYEYGVGTIVSMLLYTTLYVTYWEFMPKDTRGRWMLFPYIVYGSIATFLFYVVDNWSASLWTCWALPMYGLACLLIIKSFSKICKRIPNRYKLRDIVKYSAVVLFFIVLKSFSVSYISKEHGSFECEKEDILERRNYLVDKLVTSPREVLDEMPAGIGTQFQGEWALYSCSMLSAALVNISQLYPETKEENLQYIDS